MSKLERAKALLDAGALTIEEFEAEKARLLPSGASTNINERVQTDDRHLVDDPKSHSRWLIIAAVTAMLCCGGVIGYLLTTNRTQPPSKESTQIAASPNKPAIPPSTVRQPAVHTPAAPETEFGCLGAYSNVSFDEETGDGSGLFVRIGAPGHITWKYYEGGISRASVTERTRSHDRISAIARHLDYPNQPPEDVVFRCRSGMLTVVAASVGTEPLKRLTAQRAAELDR